MRYLILGPLEVRDGARPVRLARGRQRLLLAMLLAHANRPLSTDRLIDALWGESPPPTAAASLHNLVSGLRKLLGGDVLVTRDHGYVLDVADGDLDAQCFTDLVDRGRAALARGDPERAAGLLREGLSLWRGPALADLAFESAVQADLARLEERRLAATEERIEAELACSQHAELAEELDALAAQHPTRERLRGQQMLALYRCGRQADALRAYSDARRHLIDELGIEPGPALRRLEQAILNQDPELGAPDRFPPPSALSLRPPRAARGRRRVGVLAAPGLAAAAATAVAAVLLSGGDDRPLAADAAVKIAGRGPAREIGVGADPDAASSGGGWVWTSSASDGTVSRVDPTSGGVQTFPVGASPGAMAFGAGSLWVAVGEDRSIVRVNPQASKVVGRFVAGNGLAGVAYGAGAVWAAASIDGALVRIDAATGARRRIPVGPAPGPVAYGAGSVWVGITEAGTVARIDPYSSQVTQTVVVGNHPSALAVAPGALWVANTDDGTVSRIDPRTGTVTATVRVGREPVALAAHGTEMWVAVRGDDAVVRLDGRRAAVVGRISIGKPPGALAVLGGDVWVTTLPSERAHRGGTLRVAVTGFPRCACLDPRIVGYPPESLAFDLAYDGLVALRRAGGPAGARLVGDLATAVPQPSADGRTYVFRLRDGLRFANGQPLRATDVLASFQRLLSHPSPSGWQASIVGASRCQPRHCDLSRGIVADDRAGLVTFHLERADPDFLYKLAQPFAFVIPRRSPDRIGRTAAPGTGPYRIARFQSGPARVRIELERNPRFRVFAPAAAPDGYPDRIDLEMTPPPERPPRTDAPVEPVLSGHADLAFLSEGSSATAPTARTVFSHLAVEHAAQIHADTVAATTFLVLNTRAAPFNDARARRALNYAIDRRHAANLRGGSVAAAPTCQIIPPGFPGYQPDCPYTRHASAGGVWTAPDQRKARRLAAASGARGQRVIVWGFARFEPLVTYAVRVLRQLGYRASAHIVDEGKYFQRFADSRTRAQVGVGQWVPDYPTPANMLTPFFCSTFVPANPSANINWSELCDSRLERAAAAARRAPVGSLQATNRWAEVDRRIGQLAAAVPLTNPRTVALTSRRVRHYVFHPQFGPLMDQLWVR
jgi:peptide/nickel transport system substrate-binding protein